MSALGNLAGAAVSGIWKLAALALAGLLLAVTAGAGAALWFSDRALDKAQSELKAEQGRGNDLRVGIGTQNAAIAVLGEQRAAAEVRGTAARAQAAAEGRRYDAALQQMAGTGARVTTCDEAMPFVNKLLEDVR